MLSAIVHLTIAQGVRTILHWATFEGKTKLVQHYKASPRLELFENISLIFQAKMTVAFDDH
jgi:hypothetical protein